MSNITLTSSMRANLSSLRMISGQMGKTQERLSTGLKVNSAIDNASSYYQARSLTNRAADLAALLDNMGQGIQTINAAIEGLESGTAFLEQATAVATEALAIAKIPSKEWFANQEGVAAVVSSWSELKEALDSDNVGDIVVYGQIECQDSITLKSGQNLVGIGYYGVEDNDVDKWSKLSFTSETLADKRAITLDSKVMLSDLSLNFENRQEISVYGMSKSGIILQNIHMNLSATADSRNAGFCGGTMELRGTNNFYSSGEAGIYVTDNVKMSLSGNSSLNTKGIIHSSNVYLYDNAKINVKSEKQGLYGGSFFLYGASQICVSAGNKDSALQEVFMNLYDESKIITEGSGGFMGFQMNLWSAGCKAIMDAQQNTFKHWYALPTSFSAAAGAIIQTKEGTFQVQQPIIENILQTYTDAPPGYTKINDIAADAEKEFGDVFAYTEAENKEPEYKEEKIKLEHGNRDFISLLKEYDKLVADCSYQGGNLLKNGKLEMTFNESRSHKFSVQGNDMSAQGFGLSTAAWMTQGDVAKSLSEIASALNSIRNFQSELGNNYQIIQTRQNFTEKLGDILEAGSDNLTLADMNEESANYLALQTRQQLAINSLSLAAQSAQSILSLF